ncbi:hypothetical protein Mapa_015038 [Marchantia paleacea]|nr:hypothetical protein Mapa_015038 [Marchantia paleacea]
MDFLIDRSRDQSCSPPSITLAPAVSLPSRSGRKSLACCAARHMLLCDDASEAAESARAKILAPERQKGRCIPPISPSIDRSGILLSPVAKPRKNIDIELFAFVPCHPSPAGSSCAVPSRALPPRSRRVDISPIPNSPSPVSNFQGSVGTDGMACDSDFQHTCPCTPARPPALPRSRRRRASSGSIRGLSCQDPIVGPDCPSSRLRLRLRSMEQ